MVNIQATRSRVQQILTDLLGRIEVDDDGDFSFQNESARVFVRVLPWTEENSVVNVIAYTNIDVPPSEKLFQYIATWDESVFGHLGAQLMENGRVLVTLSETLLGEFLDPEELSVAALGVAYIANDIDDKIENKFGGKTFH